MESRCRKTVLKSTNWMIYQVISVCMTPPPFMTQSGETKEDHTEVVWPIEGENCTQRQWRKICIYDVKSSSIIFASCGKQTTIFPLEITFLWSKSKFFSRRRRPENLTSDVMTKIWTDLSNPGFETEGDHMGGSYRLISPESVFFFTKPLLKIVVHNTTISPNLNSWERILYNQLPVRNKKHTWNGSFSFLC